MKLPSIRQVASESARTFRRFPVALLCAVLGTAAALILADYEGPSGPSILFNILLAAIAGIPLLVGVAITAERRRWGMRMTILAHAAAVAALAAYAWTVPSNLVAAPESHLYRFFMLAAAMHLFAAAAPFAFASDRNGFWQYNKTLLFRLLTALLYMLVLYAGLALALAALDNLFGLHIPGKRYFELLILLLGIFTTWFFLAGIPDDLDGLESATDYPKGLRIFTQYILFPIVIVYLVILYAYLGKILIDWIWPRGWVSGLILGFSTAGIISLLLFHPLREQADLVWVKSAWRRFWLVLLPLVVMLGFALWRRISEYGITEGRYIVAALGVWLAAMAVYFLLSRKKSIRVIPVTLGIAALLAGFGPWSAFEISEGSQAARLRALFERNGIFAGGKARKAPKPVPFSDAKDISSILVYLRGVHGLDRIQPWFLESLRQDSAGAQSEFIEPDSVAALAGVEFVKVWVTSAGDEFLMEATRDGAMEVGGYERLLQGVSLGSEIARREYKEENIIISMNPAFNVITVRYRTEGAAGDSARVELQPVVDRLLKDFGQTIAMNIPREKMSIASAGGALTIKVCLRRVRLTREGQAVKIVAMDADILYTPPPAL